MPRRQPQASQTQAEGKQRTQQEEPTRDPGRHGGVPHGADVASSVDHEPSLSSPNHDEAVVRRSDSGGSFSADDIVLAGALLLSGDFSGDAEYDRRWLQHRANTGGNRDPTRDFSVCWWPALAALAELHTLLPFPEGVLLFRRKRPNEAGQYKVNIHSPTPEACAANAEECQRLFVRVDYFDHSDDGVHYYYHVLKGQCVLEGNAFLNGDRFLRLGVDRSRSVAYSRAGATHAAALPNHNDEAVLRQHQLRSDESPKLSESARLVLLFGHNFSVERASAAAAKKNRTTFGDDTAGSKLSSEVAGTTVCGGNDDEEHTYVQETGALPIAFASGGHDNVLCNGADVVPEPSSAYHGPLLPDPLEAVAAPAEAPRRRRRGGGAFSVNDIVLAALLLPLASLGDAEYDLAWQQHRANTGGDRDPTRDFSVCWWPEFAALAELHTLLPFPEGVLLFRRKHPNEAGQYKVDIHCPTSEACAANAEECQRLFVRVDNNDGDYQVLKSQCAFEGNAFLNGAPFRRLGVERSRSVAYSRPRAKHAAAVPWWSVPTTVGSRPSALPVVAYSFDGPENRP